MQCEKEGNLAAIAIEHPHLQVLGFSDEAVSSSGCLRDPGCRHLEPGGGRNVAGELHFLHPGQAGIWRIFFARFPFGFLLSTPFFGLSVSQQIIFDRWSTQEVEHPCVPQESVTQQISCYPQSVSRWSTEVAATEQSACQSCPIGTFSMQLGASSSDVCEVCAPGWKFVFFVFPFFLHKCFIHFSALGWVCSQLLGGSFGEARKNCRWLVLAQTVRGEHKTS